MLIGVFWHSDTRSLLHPNVNTNCLWSISSPLLSNSISFLPNGRTRWNYSTGFVLKISQVWRRKLIANISNRTFRRRKMIQKWRRCSPARETGSMGIKDFKCTKKVLGNYFEHGEGNFASIYAPWMTTYLTIKPWWRKG